MPDKEIYSTRLRAGRKTYFLDVKEDDTGEAYLKITESRKTGEVFETGASVRAHAYNHHVTDDPHERGRSREDPGNIRDVIPFPRTSKSAEF